ncbi:hypothetical protein CXB51_009934 [Gossypium anomalum]|uniref:NB-ARC domain-containing protein n=1 Tax=Gossypium anomalum TaxID=47600 RepID=A0A8J5Z5W0_9ROSI|nr:hypothetical protein CXB51_009934 [Gossypium anomalum]
MGCGFCEATLSNTVGTLVVDCVVKPVGRQLDYVRRFQDNVEKLLKKKRELADARKRLQHEIEEAKNRLLLIEDDVQNLQSRADETLSDMGTLEEEIQLNKRCLNWCPNWSWRYQLSKKAMKKIQDISELLDKFGELGPVGYRDLTALPTIDFLCSKEFVVSESSKAAFNQIIEALKDENINMIGLWGMGGVGKTTLAREVGSQAQKLNLFDKVVITVVSQNPKFERIQDQIAQYLRFDMKNEQGRRSEQDLWLRLKNEPRILIILDDIWESINLKKKIGIPIGDDHKGCKVLLTTRRQQVCRAMDCQNVVQLGCLDDDEAWTLFEKKAGLDDFSDDSIRTPAKKIVKKCGGLPIAIVPLASALKGKTHHEWQAAYRRLKDRRLTEIEDVEENAYVCLEASFDYLKNMETKTCFLLCSLFPEDDEIYVENLVGYAWGLELYKGMDSIKDVRSEVLASIEALKNSGLLLDCGERHVKMHDVVRQFALWIASSRKEISFGTVETLPMDESFKYYTAISFETDQTDELPKGVGFPYLKLLLHGGNRFMETSSEFFEGMKALEVCALNYRLISLAAFKFNMNLRTLCLINCELSEISMLGKLKSLHILSLSLSDITELPTEAGDLENLRRLDLSYCDNLRRIAPNLIQRLSNLEELYLHGCSSLKWATENSTKKESYSSLSELNSLPEWVVISLDISSKHLPDGFVFRRFWSFDFCIGIRRESWYEKRHLETCPISRSLRIGKSVDACKQLFEDVESLELGDVKGHPNLIPSLDLGFSKLTSLDLRWCNSMQCLIDASKQQVPITAFSNLRKLSLSCMFDLEEMCNVPQPQGFLQNLEEVKVEGCYNMQVLFPIVELRGIEQEGPSRHLSLQSLKIVEIEGCVNLKYIFPMSVANSLGQLHTLKIKSCSQLEDIIQDRPLAYKCLLQSLRDVSLIDLPQLKGRDVNDIMFTQSSLQKLKVQNCPCISTRESWYEKRDLETCPISRSLRIDESEDAYNQLFEDVESLELDDVEGHPKLIPSLDLGFSKLTSLDLGCYHSKQCLIDASKQQVPITAFSNLRKLSLSDMFDLEEMCNVPQPQGFLQNLEEVKVESCYNMQVLFPIVELRSIEQEGHSRHLSLRSLKIVEIEGCDNLKYIFPMSVANSLGQLHTLKIKSCSQLEDIIQDRPVAYKCLLQSLRDVSLIDLPQLKKRDVKGILLTQSSLQKLKVHNCPQLTHFFISTTIQELVFGKMTNQQLSNLHSCKYEELEQDQTSSQHHLLPICFPNLILIDLLECESLKSLFPIIVAQGSSKKLNAPNLQILKIKRCFGMEEIIQNSQVSTISFQCLREVQVKECNNLKFLFPMCVANSLGRLQTLKIERCFGMEEIIQDSQVSTISFQCLRKVQVTECNNLKFLFSICVTNSLGQLQTLKIWSCSQLQEIIQGSEVLISMAQGLPRLNEVELINLPQLKGMDRNNIVLTSPSLHVLKVRDCPQLTPSIVSPNIQILEFSGMTEKKQLSNVTVPESRGGTSICTEDLTISNFEELFEYPGYNLSSLEILTLSDLTELRVIWSGPKLEQVFKGDESNVIKDKEKLIHLPRLTDLVLRNLPNLVSFSPVGYHFVFPSLTYLQVKGCPNITTRFSVDSEKSVHAKTQFLFLICHPLSNFGKLSSLSSSSIIKSKQ